MGGGVARLDWADMLRDAGLPCCDCRWLDWVLAVLMSCMTEGTAGMDWALTALSSLSRGDGDMFVGLARMSELLNRLRN